MKTSKFILRIIFMILNLEGGSQINTTELDFSYYNKNYKNGGTVSQMNNLKKSNKSYICKALPSDGFSFTINSSNFVIK